MNVAFIQGIGPLELIIVLVIVLLIFGPKRLPGLARSMGSGMREFKDSISGNGGDDHDATARRDEGHAEVQAALGRPEAAEAERGREPTAAVEQPLDGEIVPERR
jgi:sec-independent protein translocase protein TatA